MTNPYKEASRGLSKEVFIYIAIKELFLTAELNANPHLRGSALIIGSGGAGLKKGDVLAVSAEAAASGLRPGMSVRKALKILPDVRLQSARYDLCEVLSERFFAILRESFKSLESLGLEEAFICSSLRGASAEGMEDAYRAAEKQTLELQRRIRTETGLHTAAGVGPNKLIARLAGLEAKKDGLVVVTANESSAFIKKLPLDSLPDVAALVKKRLTALGLNTIGDIAETPLLFLTKNFGESTGAILFESSRARGAGSILPFCDEAGFCDEVVFDKGHSDPLIIKETLYMLTEALTSRLKSEAALTCTVAVKFTLSDFKSVVSRSQLSEETDSFNSIWTGVMELLQSSVPRGNIILVGLKLLGIKNKASSGGPS